MKAFKGIITVLLIVSAVGAGFVFGWVEFQLDEGEYAILSSKTSGIDPTLFHHTGISWRWELLIPRNVTLYTFTNYPIRESVSFTTTLPSSGLYAQYTEGNPSFAVAVDAEIDYSPQLSPELFIETGEPPSQAYLDSQRATFTSELTELLKQEVLSGTHDPAELRARVVDAMRQNQFSVPAHYDLRITSLTTPDYDVYEAAKQAYLSVQAASTAARIEAQTEKATEEAILGDELYKLREYAKLFEEHPILLDYISNNSEDPVQLFSD